MMGSSAISDASNPVFSPIRESKAYQEFQKRNVSELSKLIFLMDRFKETTLIVTMDRRDYEQDEVARFSRKYLFNHYKDKEKAEKWLRKHVYRTQEGHIIYFKLEDGGFQPARDVLLEELKRLNQQLKDF